MYSYALVNGIQIKYILSKLLRILLWNDKYFLQSHEKSQFFFFLKLCYLSAKARRTVMQAYIILTCPKCSIFTLEKKIIHIFLKYRLNIFSHSYLYTSCSNNSTFCIMIRTIFTFLRTKWPATPIWKQNFFFLNIFFFVKWYVIGK